MNDFDEFKPEGVEEQIAQLAQGETEASPGSQIVHALQDFYEPDASMIDRVWLRLESAQPDNASLKKKRYERISPMQISTMGLTEQSAGNVPASIFRNIALPSKNKKQSTSRLFAFLLSAIVSVIVVGSVVFAFSLLRQTTLQPGGTVVPTASQHASPTPTSAVKPNPSGAYLVDPLGVYRFDRVNGKQIWFYDIKADPNTKPGATHFVSTRVLLSNGIAYFGGNDFTSTSYNSFYLYALNATTGKFLWRLPVASEITSLLKDEQGIIYATAANDSGYAFNSNGSVRWVRSFTPDDSSSPRQFMQIEQGVLYAENGSTLSTFRADNGQQIWTKSLSSSGGFIGGIKVVNGVLYVTNYIPSSSDQVNPTSYVLAYRASTGDRLWQSQPIDQSVFAAPEVADGLVYAGSTNNQVYALDARNGHIKWQQNAGNSIFAPMHVAGNTLIVGTSGTDTAQIIAYNATTGTRLWSHPSSSFDSPSDYHMVVTTSSIYYYANGSIHVLSIVSGNQITEFPASNGQYPWITVSE